MADERFKDMESKAREIAGVLARVINDNPYGKNGFALLIFAFDGPEMTWICNAQREDMIKALKEILRRFESSNEDEFPHWRNQA